MSAGDARHGRRDNGLHAAEYAAAGDVDPRVGEHLLDVLALDGIAAYLRPSTDLHPITRSTILPSRPTDRLYVDRAYVATARDYLTRLASEAEHAERAQRADTHHAEMREGDPAARDEAGAATADATGGAVVRGAPAGDRAPGDARPDDGPSDGASDDGAQTGRAPRQPAERGGTWPDLSGADVDAAWAEIVAGYAATADPPAAADAADLDRGQADLDRGRADLDRGRADADPRRADPDPRRADPDAGRAYLDRGEERPRRGSGLVPPEPARDLRPTPRSGSAAAGSDEPSLLDGLDTFGADLPDDGDDTFTPPVPPPVPRPSMPTALAVIGIVGGLAVFLRPDLLSFLNESLSMFLGFTAIVSGFGTLVWRLRPGDDDDDPDPDDGARV